MIRLYPFGKLMRPWHQGNFYTPNERMLSRSKYRNDIPTDAYYLSPECDIGEFIILHGIWS